MRVLRYEAIDLRPNGDQWFKVTLLLGGPEIERATIKGLTNAFLIPGTTSQIGRFAIVNGGSDESIAVHLNAQDFESVGVSSVERAATWVVEKLSTHLA